MGAVPLANAESIAVEADFYEPITWTGYLNSKDFADKQLGLSALGLERDGASTVGQIREYQSDRVI